MSLSHLLEDLFEEPATSTPPRREEDKDLDRG
jgi:hypothetical protein